MEWHYKNDRIYSTDENGKLLAEAVLTRTENGCIDVEHVYVHPDLRGQGAAGKTMLTVVDYLRKHGLQAVASCSYAHAWFRKHHKQYSDVIADEMKEAPASCKINGSH